MPFQSDMENSGKGDTSSILLDSGLREGGPVQNSAIFPPDSAIWRITRERVLLLGGAAAAILQIGLPEVALGVARHSDFRNDTLGRLHRTLEAVYVITFGAPGEARDMAERVRQAHAKVRGEDPRRYSAFSPDAQMWVLATLIQLSLEVFERWIAPLDAEEHESFYRAMRIFGEWFGLPRTHGPGNREEFASYYQAMIEGPELFSLPESRELARHIAFPEKPYILRGLWPISGYLAAEFLPDSCRGKAGLEHAAGHRLFAAMCDAVVPSAVRCMPGGMRFVPQYRNACARLNLSRQF